MARQQYAVFRAFRRAGIVSEEFHSQGFTHKSGSLEMVQLWVNLRAKDRSAKTGFQTLLKAQIPKRRIAGRRRNGARDCG
jgi:redox-sensitive bicupin YhaK (pirin superfamily)